MDGLYREGEIPMRKVDNHRCITNISKKSMLANKKRNGILLAAIILTTVMLTTVYGCKQSDKVI